MAWYYVLNGASLGPVAETEIHSLRAQNVVGLDTPVWTEGMAEWLPFANSTLSNTESSLSGAGSTVAFSGMTQTCAECGRVFPADEMLQYEGKWICASCKPVFFQRIREGVAPTGSLLYASVGRRFVALLVDGLIMAAIFVVPIMVMSVVIAASVHPGTKPGALPSWFMGVVLLFYLVPPLYEIILIGKYGATWGKMAMKIKVVRPDGSRISYARSTGRYFAKILSGMILYIGYLMAFWDEEKCALHDRICQTRVIKLESS
jgi:uncharacterized RDD family membrane protein YckC